MGNSWPRRWLGALLLAVGALPLFASLPTPLVDWPNHVARVHILSEMLHGRGAFWGRFYELGSFFVPNAALDVAILGLHEAGIGLQMAALVFVLASYLAFVGGVCALAHAWGSFDLTKIALGALLFTTGPLYWGLVNYVLGVGLAMCLLAAWIAVSRRPWLRVAVALAAVSVLFFCHLIAAAVFAGLLFCLEVLELLARRQLRTTGLSTLAAFALLLALRHISPAGEEAISGFVYAGGPSWQGIALYKLQLLWRTLFGGGWTADTLAALALLLALGLALFAARARMGRAGLLCVAALAALALVTPERIGTGSMLDYRLTLLPLLLAVCAIRLEWRGPHAARRATAAMGGVLGLHSLALGAAWYDAGVDFRAYAALTRDMPAGSVVIMASGRQLDQVGWYDHWSPPIGSIETSAVRQGVFVPMIFANPAQQPLAIRPAFVDLIQPLDLSSPETVAASRLRLQALCPASDPARRFTRVYVTTLYPQDWLRAVVAPEAMLSDHAHFLLLDGCALARPPAEKPLIADPAQRFPATSG